MSEINTEGVGIYTCSWMPGKVGWWAWTPEGVMNGWADSEAEARAMGENAKRATALIPKGSG